MHGRLVCKSVEFARNRSGSLSKSEIMIMYACVGRPRKKLDNGVADNLYASITLGLQASWLMQALCSA